MRARWWIPSETGGAGTVHLAVRRGGFEAVTAVRHEGHLDRLGWRDCYWANAQAASLAPADRSLLVVARRSDRATRGGKGMKERSCGPRQRGARDLADSERAGHLTRVRSDIQRASMPNARGPLSGSSRPRG